MGLITRARLRAFGVPESTIEGWVTGGVLEIVERGVYRQPGTAVPDSQRLVAAILRAGADARATGWSACALYGLEGFDLAAQPWIAIPPDRRVRGVGFIVQRTPLVQRDLAIVAGVAAVTPVRALVDAAIRVPARRLRVGIDDACRRGLIDLGRLLGRASELGMHRGAAAVRRLFGTGLLDQDGELERQLALALAAQDLRPAWGVEVLPGVIVDACFPEASLVVECDGRRWHTVGSDRAADLSREGALVADGWHVERVIADDLRGGGVATVQRIRDVRARRIAAGRGRSPGWRPVRPGRRIRPPRHRPTAPGKD